MGHDLSYPRLLFVKWSNAFWEGCLVWGGGVCCSFPSLLTLAANKEALMADLWESSHALGGGGGVRD